MIKKHNLTIGAQGAVTYINISDYVLEYFEGRISSDEAAEVVYNKMKQIVEE